MYSLDKLYFVDNQPCEFRYFDGLYRIYYFKMINEPYEVIIIGEGHENKIVDITPPWKD